MALCRSVIGRFAGISSKATSNNKLVQLQQCHHIARRTIFTSRRASVVFARSSAPTRCAEGRAYATAAVGKTKPAKPKAGTSRTSKGTRKAGAAKKAAPKKKKKVAAKKKIAAKKVLTPEQKARKERTKEKKEIAELKTTALIGREPKGKAATAWTVLLTEHTKGTSNPTDLKELANTYRNLAPAEREALNHTANQNAAENEAARKAWLEGFSANEIRQAQLARDRLAALVKAKKVRIASANLTPLKDSRKVRRPHTSYNIFFTERQESGDFKGLSVPERGRLLGEEWRALSSGDKQKYEDTATADQNRYRREHKQVYGFEAGSPSPSASASI